MNYNLIENAPEHCESTAHLLSWSEGNYDSGRMPSQAFLDIVGYSDEQFGCKLFNWSSDLNASFGFLEISLLADALKEYAERPADVYAFLTECLSEPEEDTQEEPTA